MTGWQNSGPLQQLPPPQQQQQQHHQQQQPPLYGGPASQPVQLPPPQGHVPMYRASQTGSPHRPCGLLAHGELSACRRSDTEHMLTLPSWLCAGHPPAQLPQPPAPGPAPLPRPITLLPPGAQPQQHLHQPSQAPFRPQGERPSGAGRGGRGSSFERGRRGRGDYHRGGPGDISSGGGSGEWSGGRGDRRRGGRGERGRSRGRRGGRGGRES